MEHPHFVTSAMGTMDATLLPVINIILGYIIKLVTTQPDFIVDKAQKLVVGAGAASGFLAGMRIGKPPKSI